MSIKPLYYIQLLCVKDSIDLKDIVSIAENLTYEPERTISLRTNDYGEKASMVAELSMVRNTHSNDKIKKLDEKWFNYHEWLIFKNEDYGTAEIWKIQVYNIQLDAAEALSKAYRLHSDNSEDNKIEYLDNKAGKKIIVFDPRVVKSAFYLRYCILLLQSCGDKLAQMIRCALGITHWLKKNNGEVINIEATENNTSLKDLKNHLNLKLKSELPDQARDRYQNIFEELNKYLAEKDNPPFMIRGYANRIKHKWQLYYQGEGLHQVRPEIKDSRIKELPGGVLTVGEDINKHINLCLETNNMFVDIANTVLNHLDFNRFYTDKNEMKILEIGVKR